MIAWAASRNRCTLCSARSFAARVERSTARCFQAGSSTSVLTSGPVFCAIGRTLLHGSGSPPANLPRAYRTHVRPEFSFSACCTLPAIRSSADKRLPALHHEPHILRDGDVLQRVVRDADDVGEQPFGQPSPVG